MGNPGGSGQGSTHENRASRAKAFNAVQVAKGSATTDAQHVVGSLKISSSSPSSFEVGDHVSQRTDVEGDKSHSERQQRHLSQ